jgi:hypothetical protein
MLEEKVVIRKRDSKSRFGFDLDLDVTLAHRPPGPQAKGVNPYCASLSMAGLLEIP